MSLRSLWLEGVMDVNSRGDHASYGLRYIKQLGLTISHTNHIWQNFATLAIFLVFGYIFTVSIWQHSELALAIFMIGMGKLKWL